MTDCEPTSAPPSSGPSICPTEYEAVNQPKPASRRSSGAMRAIEVCPAIVKARCPSPSTALAAAMPSTDGSRASPAPPMPSMATPAQSIRRSEDMRSETRPSHSAVNSGRIA